MKQAATILTIANDNSSMNMTVSAIAGGSVARKTLTFYGPDNHKVSVSFTTAEYNRLIQDMVAAL